MYEEIKRKINIYRRYKYWADAKCIFIHVPKSAGTSVSKAIYGRTLGHYSAAEISNAFPDLYKNSFTFGFVRNPWDRVLSAYSFAKLGRTSVMGVRNPEQYKIEEFSTFERFVCEWLPNQNLEKVDFIFRQQSDYLCDREGEIAVDKVGFVETLDLDLGEIARRLNKKIDVVRENSTRGADDKYRDYYSIEMRDIVACLYSKDIENFGYVF